MCFNNPFPKEKLIQLANLSQPIEYERYLIGRAPSNKTLNNINFEDVSFQINDFLRKAVIQFKYGGRLVKRLIKHEQIHNQSWGWRHQVTKCFTFNVPYLESTLATSMAIYFNASIYPNGQRPMDGAKPGGLQLFSHHPNQFGRSLKSKIRYWPQQNKDQGYKMMLYLKEVEILRMRNKPQAPCTNSPPYDDALVQHIINTLNCTPPYFKSSNDIPICKTKESLRKASLQFRNIFHGVDKLNPPCRQVLKIDSSYREQSARGIVAEGLSKDEVLLKVYYRPHAYREIGQIRAYNAMALFGNVGGFIGMLLGYAFVQIPMLVHTLFESWKDGTLL